MDKMLQWKELSDKLKKIKKEEMALRKELCGLILDGLALPASKKIETGTHIVSAKAGLSYSIDEAVLSEVWNKLDSAEKEAIKLKPNLVKKAYNEIPPESLLHDAIITKPSAPTLSVEEV